jgi:hypothetical protein
MTKGMQLWPNDRMRAFFLAHIRRETSLDDAEASRLTDALLKAVNRMLVWDMPQAHAPAKGKAGAKTVAPATGPAAPGKSPPASPSGNTTVGTAPKPAFDPYAFSATVVLAKTGRDGLMKRLGEFKTAENLKAFAEAQHLGIDRKLNKIEDLRKAILAATEQRLADRKAAAS